ncbi:UNVERIFIED_CONTAM: hypothetical protein K2H54_019560 [Gekko kuhli]
MPKGEGSSEEPSQKQRLQNGPDGRKAKFCLESQSETGLSVHLNGNPWVFPAVSPLFPCFIRTQDPVRRVRTIFTEHNKIKGLNHNVYAENYYISFKKYNRFLVLFQKYRPE